MERWGSNTCCIVGWGSEEERRERGSGDGDEVVVVGMMMSELFWPGSEVVGSYEVAARSSGQLFVDGRRSKYQIDSN